MNALLRAMPAVALAAAVLTGCSAPPPCRLCDAVEARDLAAVRALLAQGEAVTARVLETAADPNRVVARSPPGGQTSGSSSSTSRATRRETR